MSGPRPRTSRSPNLTSFQNGPSHVLSPFTQQYANRKIAMLRCIYVFAPSCVNGQSLELFQACSQQQSNETGSRLSRCLPVPFTILIQYY